MMKHDDFCVLILTHGRANNVITVKGLKKCGYTGPVFFVVDNEDRQIDAYRERFGSDKVVVFDKKRYADMTDEGDNLEDRRTITHARNASYDIAKQLGYKYFIQLDDDYNIFSWKFDGDLIYKQKPIKDLDSVWSIMLDFYKGVKNIDCLAMAQNGDFIGGGQSTRTDSVKLWRKAMNSFICSTERRVKFIGRMNEDVNTYVKYGNIGRLFFTTNYVALNQKPTQSNPGGITDMYLDFGTYVKAFFTVMYNPSCVRIKEMGQANRRLHHSINWKRAVPMIVRDGIKKV